MKIFEVKSDENICCPFCNQIVLVNDGESAPDECPHTLLIATDMGIEYCSGTLDTEKLEEQADDSSWDQVLSEMDYSETTLIKMYEGAPGFFGAYYMFQE